MKALFAVVRIPAATLAAAFFLWLGQVAPVAAGYDEGAAAFIRGDYEVAWQEWLALGERGHQSAQYNLGVLYSIGLGVEQDDEEASKWFRRAADRGLPAAQMRLGTAYLEGKGVPEDVKEAYFWFSLASSHFTLGEQHEQAVAARESAGAKLTRAQISEVLEKAMDWRPVQQTFDASERERLIAAPADEEVSARRGGEPNGSSARRMGSEASPAPTTVVKSAAAADASQADAPQPAVAEARVAAPTGTLETSAPVETSASEGTSAPGPDPAGPAETAAAEAAATGELPTELAAATDGPQAQEPSETSDPAASGSFAVHLSSVRSKDGTEAEWQKLQAQFPNLLNGRSLAVGKIELAEQGTFYRVMAAPFADVDAAEALCAQLEARDQYCAVRNLGADQPQ